MFARNKNALRVFALSAAAAMSVYGQTPAPAAEAAKPAEEAKPLDLTAPICFNGVCILGLVDGYYNKNFNNPASRTNQLRNFDVKANQMSLNMAKLGFYHDPDPVGFKLEFMFGRAAEVFHFAEVGDAKDAVRNILQAYVSFKPKNMGGFQFDFGKFVTTAGAELTETHLNWNYSRPLLYANGPYYHFGARVTKPLGSHFSVGAQLVNGWNNVEDNNSGKTVGLTAAVTGSKASWYNTYYVGPEKTDTNKGVRNFYDTVLLLTPSSKSSTYLTFDYGKEGGLPGDPSATFYGFGIASKFQATKTFALTPRFEYYKDKDGFITGTAQALKEFTMTAEVRMADPFITRFEYRGDWSDKPYYERGTGGTSKTMHTLLVGFIFFFGK